MEDIYFGTLEDEYDDCIDSTIFEQDLDDIEDEDYEDYSDNSSEENKIKYGY